MNRWRLVAGVGFAVALLLTVSVVTLSGRSSTQPVGVMILGHTNGMVSCVISNKCARTLKIWAVVYGECAPFRATNGPNQWTMVTGHQDSYLKPSETRHLTFHRPAIAGHWRLMIPWSDGYRAKIRDRIHKYKFIPVRYRVAPEYYAASAVITE